MQSAVLGRYEEPYRPQYHFSPETGWLGDPDGLIHYNGSFSLFWWGKATSTDLVHYTQESSLVMTGDAGNVRYFSGSVVVDKRNTAGFGVNAQVAVYTLFDKSTKRQAQGISSSSDGRQFQFYSSPDLKAWTLLSDFSAPSVGREVWECPDLIELPVDGDPSRKKWVLVVSVDWSHEEYFIGDFDGTRFVQSESMHDSHSANDARYMDLGLDFYASRTFRDYDETLTRTTSLGWVSTWAYANQVPSSWGMGFWSIPRDLALKSYPEGVRLLQTPVGGLKGLRQEPVAFVASLTAGTRVLPKFRPKRNVYEVDATFDTNIPNRFGFDLCVGNGHRVAIRYDSQSQILTIDRTNSSVVPIPGFARQASAPVAPLNNRLRLHIYVDTSSVEVFANEGKEVFTLLTYAGDAQTEIEIFAEHRGTIMRFKGWRLKSIWHETPKRRAP
ncbi:MAG: GH32 C-terminal domain-containing protein [Steroidobacteraceae bacterium]